MKMKKIGLITAALCIGLGPGPALATPPDSAGTPCAIDTIDSSLRSVLMMIARNKGIRIQLSEKVNGVVSGSVQSATCDQLFDFLLKSFNLLSFHDGEILHISTMEEISSKVIYIKTGSPADVLAQIKALDLWGQGHGIRYSDKSKVLYVTGHEKYVQIVEDIIEEFENQDDVKVLYGGQRSSLGLVGTQLEAPEQ